MVKSLAPEQVYWSRLEVPFVTFMLRLSETWEPDELEPHAAVETLMHWAREIRRIAHETFGETVGSLDLSDRELRAMARAERQMNWQLHQLLDPYLEREEVRT